jgi:hypothetical protein
MPPLAAQSYIYSALYPTASSPGGATSFSANGAGSSGPWRSLFLLSPVRTTCTFRAMLTPASYSDWHVLQHTTSIGRVGSIRRTTRHDSTRSLEPTPIPHYSNMGGMLSSIEHGAEHVYHRQDRVSSKLHSLIGCIMVNVLPAWSVGRQASTLNPLFLSPSHEHSSSRRYCHGLLSLFILAST